MLFSSDSTILQAQKPGRRRIVSQGCDPLIVFMYVQRLIVVNLSDVVWKLLFVDPIIMD